MPDNVVSLPQRGKTYLTGPNRTADSTGTTSIAIQGIRKVFRDFDYGASGANGVFAPRSSGEVVCVLVRNASGRTLLPKMAVRWKDGQLGKQVDGFSAVESGPVAGIVDEYLPSAGVAANDLFWIAVKGPSLCLKSVDSNTIAYGDWVTAITAAATTTSTTAGRIKAVAATSESTTTLSHALNRIGQAMSTSNTSGVSTDFRVYVNVLTT